MLGIGIGTRYRHTDYMYEWVCGYMFIGNQLLAANHSMLLQILEERTKFNIQILSSFY